MRNFSRFFGFFLVLIIFCGNPTYIYGLDDLTSRNDLTNFRDGLSSDIDFAGDLFNHRLLYVNPNNIKDDFAIYLNNSLASQYSNLKDAVAHSSPGDTIYLVEGNYSGENNTNITIDHDLNIVGLSPVPDRINSTNETEDELINNTNDTGIIFDGEGRNSFFNILGSCTVTLGNLTLINGYSSSDGGAIHNSGNLLIDTTFIKNSVIKSDRFATEDGMGGAIYNRGDLSLDYVTCEGNNATGYSRGGVIYNAGTMNISDSAFCNNSGGSGGGAIYSTGSSTIFNCVFAYNKAGSESGESGGAIYNGGGGLSVDLSTFVNNTADAGGAIDTHDTVLDLQNNDFVFNNARMDGGAVRIRQGERSSVNYCNFANNTANNGAGLYYSDGAELNVNDSSFVENFALGDGGGLSLKKGKLNLNRASVTHNNCLGLGGGIYNYDSDVVLNNLSVMFNVGGSDGGGLYTTGGHSRSVDLRYGVFSDNFAMGDGGAVYADTNSRFIVSYGVFSANNAKNGGGIFSRNSVVVSNGSFVNNTARENGAGLNLKGNYNKIIGSLFDENKAQGDGGGIYNGGDAIECRDCLLYRNNANGDGGALFAISGLNDFYHNQFEDNHCDGYGGAVFADAINSFSKSMNDFRGNTAGKDGDNFITTSDKEAKANAGIIGYAISAFLIAVIGTIATIATCGAAAVPVAGLAGFLIGLGIGVVGAALEYGVTELIAFVNAEFDDYRKEHVGVMMGIGIAMNILGMIAGTGIAKLIVRYGTGTIPRLLLKGLTGNIEVYDARVGGRITLSSAELESDVISRFMGPFGSRLKLSKPMLRIHMFRILDMLFNLRFDYLSDQQFEGMFLNIFNSMIMDLGHEEFNVDIRSILFNFLRNIRLKCGCSPSASAPIVVIR